MKNTIKIATIAIGYVDVFKPRTDTRALAFASVLVPDLNGRQLTATEKCGPLSIRAGKKSPEFVRPPGECNPVPADELVLEIAPVDGVMKVTAWGYAESWRKAEEEIAERPEYRVVRQNRFQGEVIGGQSGIEIVFTGNLPELIAEQLRDGLRESFSDKFAPVYKAGPCTGLNRFLIKKKGCNWEPCEDPRPFPKGQLYRVMFWKNGKFVQLGVGTELELNWKFPRGKNDPLRKYKVKKGESRGYLYWERRDAVFSTNTQHACVWTEVSDPRAVSAGPKPAVTEPVVAKSAAVKPVSAKPNAAMPKSEKKRQTVLRNLGDLVLA